MKQHTKILHKNVVFILAVAALFLPVAAIEYSVLNYTNGSFMYPLDDTFIHLSIAKNLAFYNNWGITKSEFASASSSVLYTIILALSLKIFSSSIVIPFIINAIAGVFVLVSLQQWLKKENVSETAQLIILTCIIFFTPLPILIVSGMEHTLQCLFSFLFISKFSEWLEEKTINSNTKNRNMPWQLFLYGALVCFIRYEGIFLIAVACFILLYHKKIAAAFTLGIVSILPILIFGIYSISKGSYFFPNSVLLKSQSIDFSLRGIVQFFSDILIQKLTVEDSGITELATQRLLVILPFTYLVFLKQLNEKPSYRYILIILICATLLHLSFASTGWFYRYEAYLILNSVAIISVLIYKYGKSILTERVRQARAITLLILFALSFPLILRSAAGFSKATQACINIYEQQYQMSQFLKKYYNTKAIAANDIGAVTYFRQANDLDLWGLGNIEVAKSRKNKYYSPDFLDSLSRKRDAKIAVVYDSWFSDSLLCKWQKVATWQIENNVICGGDIVSFYAIDPSIETELKENLQEYQKSLPSDVKVMYY